MATPTHYKKATESLDYSFDRIKSINMRLMALTTEIKESQPKTGGAITLHLYDCGKECMGCPHPTWLHWFLRKKNPGNTETIMLSTKIDNPMRRLKRTGEFVNTFEKTRLLVQEALNIIEERSNLVEAISRLNRRSKV